MKRQGLLSPLVAAFSLFSADAAAPMPVAWWRGEGGLDAYGRFAGNFGGGNIEGVSGGAFHFEAGRSLVVPGGLGLGKAPGLTVVAWIKPEGSVMGIHPIITFGTTGQRALSFSISGPSEESVPLRCLYLKLNSQQMGGFQTMGHTITPGVWQRVGFTWDRATGVAMVFGGGSASGSSPLPAQLNGDFNIGKDPYRQSSFLGGMDEVVVFDRALTWAQIEALPNQPPQPTMTFTQAAEGKVRIAWPADFAQFRLESAITLENGWNSVEQAPTAEGSEVFVERFLASPQEMFRLRYP